MGSHTNPARRNDAARTLDSIRRIVQALRQFDSQAQTRTGLSGAQLFILRQLRGGKAISINELAARTCTDQSSASVVAQKLADRKLAVHGRSASDARRVELTIAPAGRRILKSAPQAAQERMIQALAKMSPKKRRQLADCLHEWVERIGLNVAPVTLFFEDVAKNKGKKGK